MKKFGIATLLLSPVIGFIAVLWSSVIWGDKEELWEAANLPAFFGITFENMFFYPTVISLFGVGLFLGYFGHRFWFINGILSMSLFPVMTIYELFADPTSHNLWPIEIFIQLLFSIPAVIGSFIGKTLCQKKNSKRR